MARQIQTKPTRVGSDGFFLAKAKKFVEGAQALMENGNWDSAAVLSVHATISACDAVTAKYLNCRCSSAEHLDVLGLIDELPAVADSEKKTKKEQIRHVLGLKNIAEYEDRSIDERTARELLTRAERIVDWAASKLS